VKKFLFVAILVTVAAQPLRAVDFVLTVARPEAGQWQVFGQLSTNTDNDGLSSLIIDVSASGGDVAVSSSLCKLPYGTHYWLDGNVHSQLVGFTEFRSNGSSGIGICAGQKTTSLGQVVLTDVGYSAGSYPGDQTGGTLGPTLISWSSPVLIASGTYSGHAGTLSVALGAGQVNVLEEGRDPSATGGVRVLSDPSDSVSGGQIRIYCPGDATGDDHVDGGDLAVMGGHWLMSGMTWAEADFTGDGLVDGGDLALIGSYWNWSLPSPAAPKALSIPEPATAALLVLGAATLPTRRRRR
jgi:hypothetical protein